MAALEQLVFTRLARRGVAGSMAGLLTGHFPKHVLWLWTCRRKERQKNGRHWAMLKTSSLLAHSWHNVSGDLSEGLGLGKGP